MKNIIAHFLTTLLSLSSLYSKEWIDTGEANPSNPNWTIYNNSEIT